MAAPERIFEITTPGGGTLVNYVNDTGQFLFPVRAWLSVGTLGVGLDIATVTIQVGAIIVGKMHLGSGRPILFDGSLFGELNALAPGERLLITTTAPTILFVYWQQSP